MKAIIVALFAALFIGVAATFGKGSSSSGNNPVQQPTVPDSIGGIFSSKIQTITWGVAMAEGYGPNANLPTRANNPCDLTVGDENGFVTHGTANAEGVLIFTPNTLDGWYAAYKKFFRIATGYSRVYTLDMDFYDLAVKYTGANNDASNNWAEVVASACGVDPSTTLGAFFNA